MSSTKLHQRPPFRAEHLGSLLRPQNLLDTRVKIDKKEAQQSQLETIEDSAINDVIKLQTDLGYHPISDGEYRRHMFWGSFFPGLEGFEEIKNPPLDIFRSYMPDIVAFTEKGHKPGESVICTGKIKHVGSTYVGQWNYLKNRLPKERWGELKLTLPAPEWYHMRYSEGRAYPKDVYNNDEEYFADIAKAYQTELQILYDAGLRNVQIDDPNFAYFCAVPAQKGYAADKTNSRTFDGLLDTYIKLYNDCLAARPADMHVGLHICRGNFVGSRHFSEGGYDDIATKLFNNINVDTYYLEYDTPRAGGFEPLKFLPKDRNVILGIITSKFPELEDITEMKKKVDQAASLIAEGTGQTKEQAMNQLGVSPQCGFASHSSGNAVTHDDMVAKLKLVRKLADELWPGQP
ncbi:MAG: SAGA HAT/Core module component [Chaenotheca gracillima]|nr:MAG: SAGA HAT/Core module component [Chaenotheca gracillima]